MLGRSSTLLAIAVALFAVSACHDSSLGGPCPSGVCGFYDHRHDSTFYCPPAPLRPGGWYGYSWRDPSHCHQECAAAASFGCDASACDAVCEVDEGSGQWLACDEANGATVTDGGCFLSGSGVNGETVPCVCR